MRSSPREAAIPSLPCRPGKARRCAGLGFPGYSDARSGCGEERGGAVGEEVMLTEAGGGGLDADRAEPNGVRAAARVVRREIFGVIGWCWGGAVAGAAATPAGSRENKRRCPVTPDFGDQDPVDPEGCRRQGQDRTRVCRSSCSARITRAIATRTARTSPRAPGPAAHPRLFKQHGGRRSRIRGTHDQQRRVEARRL